MADIFFRGTKYTSGKEILRTLSDQLGTHYVFEEINGSATVGWRMERRHTGIELLLGANSNGRIEFHGDLKDYFANRPDEERRLCQRHLLQQIQTIPHPIVGRKQAFPGAELFAYAEEIGTDLRKIIENITDS